MTGQIPAIRGIALWVQNPDALAQFYCDVLGMTRQNGGGAVAVGYGGQGAALILNKSSRDTAYQHAKTDRYWKIALTLPDLDHAQRELSARGIAVSAPHQFRDIAYMSHLSDPEGHVIELIQHTFDGRPLSVAADPSLPLGGGVQIGLITLRTNNIETEMQRCQSTLGMTYLSRQSLADLGFDLYFLALTSQQAPMADVNALENRAWLWQRPYTVLEFQHVLNGPDIQPAATEPAEVLITDAMGHQVCLH